MTDMNREIIAEEIFASEDFAWNHITDTTTRMKRWKEMGEIFREYRRLQADYLMSKFRMILLDEK
ncbi:hypothetical protein FACS1894189_3540 [Planctomycetales bacterium]|nr:hypothetical protein FACS1894189_3540 [Planctomycetales bacterium]